MNIFNYLKTIGPGIFCLQEIYATQDDIEQWSKEWNDKCIINPGSNHSRGVAILFHKIDVEIKNSIQDE